MARLPRNHIAALDTSTGLATAWDPNASSDVNALAVSGSTVYAGGLFRNIGGLERNCIAALDVTTGAPTAWNPDVRYNVFALAVSGSTVYAGGMFWNVGGRERNCMAALNAATGVATAWNPDAKGWDPATAVLALAVSGSTVYAGGNFASMGGDYRVCFAEFGPAPTAAGRWRLY